MAAITSAGSGTWSSSTPNAPWPSGTIPTAGDTVIIANTHTVTLDQAATLNIGADSATAAISISLGGKLQYLSTATNSLTIDAKGDIVVAGTLEFGTSGNPIPSSRTVTIKLNDSSVLADGKYGLKVNSGGVCNLYGASKTLSTVLTADVAANATTFVVNDVTGWAASDTIAIGSTTRTPGDAETVTVASIATKTITIQAGGGTGANSVAHAHGGGGTTMNGIPITAEALNLTLNVKVTSANTADAGFVTIASGSTFTAKYVEFSFLGANVSSQHGLEFAGTGSAATFCSVHDSRNMGVYFSTNSGSNTFSNSVCYNLNTQIAASSAGVTLNATSGTHVLDTNVFMSINVPAAGSCIGLFDVGSTFTNNVVSSCGPGGATSINALALAETAGVIGTFTGNVIHSCVGTGLILSSAGMSAAALGTTANPIVSWRNGLSGLNLFAVLDKIVGSVTLFGNGTQNILVPGFQPNTLLHDSTLNSDSTFATTNGVSITTSSKLNFENSTFGATNAHTQDFLVAANFMADVLLINCSTVTSSFTANALQSTVLRQQRFGQTAAYKTVSGVGVVLAEQSTRHTASGYAWQGTPSSAARPLIIPGPTVWDTFRVAVVGGTQVTVSCWVQYDASYNGAAMPTLTLVGGILQGIASDVTSVAAGASSGTWLQLSVSATPTESGVAECYVSGLGTAGNFFVDDFQTSQP